MTNDLKFLIKLVKKANKLINEDLQIYKKGEKGDIVTNFDLKIEEFINSTIKAEYENFEIISEEYNSQKELTKNCFVVDPIDGTLNFAHGYPFWGIQIACIKNFETCAAVIFIPKLNQLYAADKNGCYLNNQKLTITNHSPEECLYCIEGPNKAKHIEQTNLSKRLSRNTNSASVNFAFVASGVFGGMLFKRNSVWDYIPGLYIVKQAGGYTIDESNTHIAANSKEMAEILYNSTKNDKN